MQKLVGQLGCRHHFQECAFGVGVREHDAGANLGAIFQHHAARPAVADIDVRHRCGGPDFDSELSSRRCQRLGDRAHAAHHVSIEALQFVLAAAQQMEEQADGRARLIRSAMLAINVVGKEHGLHFFGLVIVIEKFAQASGQEGNQLRDFVTRNPAEFFSHAKQVGPAAHASGVDLRRRLHEKRLQVARQFFQLVVDLDKSFRILGGNLFEFRFRPFAVGPPGDDVSIGEGNLNRGIAGHHAQSVFRRGASPKSLPAATCWRYKKWWRRGSRERFLR